MIPLDNPPNSQPDSRREPPDERALDALVMLSRDGLRGQAPRRGERTFRRLREALAARRTSRRSRAFRLRDVAWPQLTAVALATVALCALGLDALRDTTKRLDYRVSGAVAMASGEIVGGEQTHLRFTDGSELTLARGAHARVASLDARGGHIALSEGKAHLAIEKRPHARWTVRAGPYEVRVTGTAFDVRWAPNDRSFELAMQHGEVYVTGPLLAGAVRVRAGEGVRTALDSGQVWIGDASLARAETATEKAQPTATAPGPPADALRSADNTDDALRSADNTDDALRSADNTSPTPLAAATDTDAPRAQTAAERRGRRFARGEWPWAERLARGDFVGVLRAAEVFGLERALSEAPLPELAALGDAARFQRRNELARRALLSTRERFPKSTVAADAAFLLGRLEEDLGGERALEEALAWYARYLRESPHGPYAGQARGRRMLQVYKTQGAEAARPLAKAYLEHHASGAYAATARRLAGASPQVTR